MRGRLSSAALGLALAAAGCSLDRQAVPAEEVVPTACKPWSRPDAKGACRLREFTRPTANDTLGDPGASHVMVAVDGLGLGLAAWDVGIESVVRLQAADESSPGVWHPLDPAAKLSGGSDIPAVRGGIDGSAVIAWKQTRGDEGGVYLSERSAAGGWSDPPGDQAAISFPPKGFEPRLAGDASGGWVLVWNQWHGTGYGVSVATRARSGDPWTRPASALDTVSPHIFFSNAPIVVVDPSGRGLISWYQSVGKALVAFASERPSAGAPFSRLTVDDYLSVPEQPVDSDVYANPKPALAADGRGAVAWTQEDGTGGTRVYLATRDAAGKWTRPSGIDDAVTPKGIGARAVQLVFTVDGELVLVWHEVKGGSATVYSARRRSDGSWVAPGRRGLPISNPANNAIEPRLATGPGGGVLAVWYERAPKKPFRIQACRTSAGEAWGAVETLSPDTGDDAIDPSVAMGPGDRALVGWTQGPGARPLAMIARLE